MKEIIVLLREFKVLINYRTTGRGNEMEEILLPFL